MIGALVLGESYLAGDAPILPSFRYYTPFTIATGQVPTTQTGFTAVIKPTDARFKDLAHGGFVDNPNGIRPFLDSALTSAIPFELVPGTYDSTTGTFEMYLQVDAADGLVIYLAYGDPTLTTSGSGNPFDSHFKRVYHFGDGATLSATDSTGNQNGTFVNTPTAGVGQIDGAASFVAASTQYMTSSNTLNPIAVTMEAWIKATSLPAAYNSVIVRSGAEFWQIHVKSNGKVAVYVNTTGGTFGQDGTGTNTLSAGTWYFVTAVYSNASGLITYVNAVIDSGPTNSGFDLNTSAIPLRIASDPANASREWDGLIDEVRISDIARSANWITTSYNNQLAPNTFWSMGSQVTIGAVSGAFITSAAALYAQTVSPGAVTLTGAAIASGAALFAQTVTPQAVTITGAFIAAGNSLFAQTITVGAVTLTGAVISSGSALNAPTVTPDGVLAGAFIASGSSLAVPSVTPGAVTLTGAFISAGNTRFAPSVAVGAATLMAPFLSSAAILYAPTIQGGITIWPGIVMPGDLSIQRAQADSDSIVRSSAANLSAARSSNGAYSISRSQAAILTITRTQDHGVEV